MKKLNRKGFTLIELLAIIVILAIIMVVTIPTVLGSMNKARANQLQNAADSAAEWFTKQYELASMGNFAGGADTVFNTFVAGEDGKGTFVSLNLKAEDDDDEASAMDLTNAVLEAAGIANSADSILADVELGDSDINDNNSFVYFNTTNNKVCVQLTAKSGGSFYVSGDTAYTNIARSSGCPDFES